MHKIAILIPVFNKLDLTIKCIESLLPLIDSKDFKNLRAYIVIVDDGSADGTGSWIKTNYPDIILLSGCGNLWWSGGTSLHAGRSADALGPGQPHHSCRSGADPRSVAQLGAR